MVLARRPLAAPGIFVLAAGCGNPSHPPPLSESFGGGPGTVGGHPGSGLVQPPTLKCQGTGACYVAPVCAGVGGTCCEGNPWDPSDAGTPDAQWTYIVDGGQACVTTGPTTIPSACVPCTQEPCPVDAGSWQFSGLDEDAGLITVSQCTSSSPPASTLTDVMCSGIASGPANPGYQEPPFDWTWSLHGANAKLTYMGMTYSGHVAPCQLVLGDGPQCVWFSTLSWPTPGGFWFAYSPDIDVVYIAYNVAPGWNFSWTPQCHELGQLQSSCSSYTLTCNPGNE